MLFARENCAYHTGDDSGKTYDFYGKVCPSLTDDQKVSLAAGLAFCGVVLLGTAGWWLGRYLRNRSRARAEAGDRPGSMMESPLMGYRDNFSPVIPHGQQFQPQPQSPAPISPYTNSSSGFSPTPETFHFPVLSADGHLLPPAPASSRGYVEVARSESPRPLPSPPPEYGNPYAKSPLPSPPVLSPIPTNPNAQRWSYRADDESSQGHGAVGIYPSSSPAASPRISQVDRSSFNLEPQSAIFHRSFSAEGEDLAYYARGSDDGHRRL